LMDAFVFTKEKLSSPRRSFTQRPTVVAALPRCDLL
jgi:hypothetical protein